MFALTTIEYTLIGALVVLLVWVLLLEVRLHRLVRGSSGASLEAHIARIGKENVALKETLARAHATLTEHDKRITGSVRGVGLEKFNPFAGNGTSKPSFALAIVSEKGDGVVLSTLHTRDTVSIFTKTITDFRSEKELSAEEAVALEKARKTL